MRSGIRRRTGISGRSWWIFELYSGSQYDTFGKEETVEVILRHSDITNAIHAHKFLQAFYGGMVRSLEVDHPNIETGYLSSMFGNHV